MIPQFPNSLIFQQQGNVNAEVTVCISCYNRSEFIQDTLSHVYNQTCKELDLILVDDCSTDSSIDLCQIWLEENKTRFNNIFLVKHLVNSGLPSVSRNTAINLTVTPFIFMLDSDNLIYPRCVETCLEVLNENENAALVYTLIERFGNEIGIMGNQVWDKDILACGNYIDTMALIRKSALEKVNGYSDLKFGWEDFDLWCKFAENKFWGIQIPQILARYRVHKKSQTHSRTKNNLNLVIREIKNLHPWLKIEEIL